MLEPGVVVGSGLEQQEYELPTMNAYNFWLNDSLYVGYGIQEKEAGSSHFWRAPTTYTNEDQSALIVRLACHFYVDLITAPHLDELLGRIRDIYSYQQEIGKLPSSRTLPAAIFGASKVKQYESAPFSFEE